MITYDCIEWDLARNTGGYGQIRVNGIARLAHRLAWEDVHGPIPNGMCICHRCDNPPCFNVDHLFLGTTADNAKDRSDKGRGHGQGRTHCPHGHPYDASNLYFSSGRKRACRECRKARCRRAYLARKALA